MKKTTKKPKRTARRSVRKPAKKKTSSPKKRIASRANPEDAKLYFARLEKAYPDAKCALHHRDAYELLVATILSAQCTDVRVNLTTPALFQRYPDAPALAGADRGALETMIKSTGFFRNKAKSLAGMATAVVKDHGGLVPHTMEELTALPGVGRKTANVVLGNVFGINEGVVVDTHVARLAKLMGLTKETDPVKIERDLMALFPRDDWTLLSHLLIEHGRKICIANRPKCGECVVADRCPSARTAN
ncbi:MAG TPA: endonuclease III [Gemmatimonadaceae bacterium]|nr:endonuclease III [Gemmatimonadaceae bacterium]